MIYGDARRKAQSQAAEKIMKQLGLRKELMKQKKKLKKELMKRKRRDAWKRKRAKQECF